MELEAEGLPISVPLVKPTSIDTPLFDKAKTVLEVEPQPVPPCAQRWRRWPCWESAPVSSPALGR